MEYKSIPFTAKITRNDSSVTVARQLQRIIDEQTPQGWEFVRIETIETFVAPENGCFGIGAQAGFTTFFPIIVFQKMPWTLGEQNVYGYEEPLSFAPENTYETPIPPYVEPVEPIAFSRRNPFEPPIPYSQEEQPTAFLPENNYEAPIPYAQEEQATSFLPENNYETPIPYAEEETPTAFLPENNYQAPIPYVPQDVPQEPPSRFYPPQREEHPSNYVQNAEVSSTIPPVREVPPVTYPQNRQEAPSKMPLSIWIKTHTTHLLAGTVVVLLLFIIGSNLIPLIGESNGNNTELLASLPGKYPHASSKYLSPSDISHLSKDDLRMMRNEIFARKGFIFEKEDMRQYFSQQAWYRGRYKNYKDVMPMLSNIENANVEMIKKAEKNAPANLVPSHSNLTSSPPNPAISHEAMIQEIKDRYTYIMNANYHEEAFLTNCVGGTITYQRGDNEIKRIVVFKGNSFLNYKDEYFFWQGELFFVLTQAHTQGNGRTAMGSDDEMRFYIRQRNGIQCRKDEKTYSLSGQATPTDKRSNVVCDANVIAHLVSQGEALKNRYNSRQFKNMPCN